jgi:hypothetical protein
MRSLLSHLATSRAFLCAERMSVRCPDIRSLNSDLTWFSSELIHPLLHSLQTRAFDKALRHMSTLA